MAELVWRAFIRCTDEAPWMETYCRSAVYVGARTRLKESVVHVESADRSPPGALTFRIAPTVLDSRGCEAWFDLPHPTRVSLKVYDVRGRFVRSIEDRFAMAGRHVSAWDGNDASGGAVAPGVYFVRPRYSARGGHTEGRRHSLNRKLDSPRSRDLGSAMKDIRCSGPRPSREGKR